MPSLNDLASAFALLGTHELEFGLVIAVGVVVLVADWRIALVALAAQYLLVAVLLSTLIPLQIAAVRMIAGGLVAMMFYITARRVQPNRRRRAQTPPQESRGLTPRAIFWVNLPFRFVGLTLVAVGVIAASDQIVLLNAPLLFWVTGLWLTMGGLLTIALTRDALRLGMGLLFFTSGFGIIYLSIDNSLVIYALLVIADLVIALAIAHIASAPAHFQGKRRGEM
ncbi:MAG: hypothetical protein HDKAJFGB_03502 [Anaerolineae bacterium]|nr:hypothetical protein [Anaerolineae bacterium]